jgi:hypothetical protein
MSVEFVVFSALPPAELERVEQECRARLEAWFDDHEDSGDEWGEFALGGWVPPPEQAAQMVWLAGDRGPAPSSSARTKQILARLKTIRSAITIERPGNLEVDRLQVSILRFLVERAGPGLAP